MHELEIKVLAEYKFCLIFQNIWNNIF